MLENETWMELFLNVATRISFALGEVRERLVASKRARRSSPNITFECGIVNGELRFTALTWEDQQPTPFIACVVRGDGRVSVQYSANDYSVEYLSPANALRGIITFFEKYTIMATRE